MIFHYLVEELLTPVSVGTNQNQYNAPQVSNPLDFEWNPFQNIVTSYPTAGGNPNQPYRSIVQELPRIRSPSIKLWIGLDFLFWKL